MSARVTAVSTSLSAPPVALALYWETLSDGERARAARMVREEDRARFIAAHGVLRTVLGRALARDPCALEFAYGRFGKPYLAENGKVHPLRFNLSHGGDVLLIAFCEGCEVGVDVEIPRRVVATAMDAVARAAFTLQEQASLLTLPQKDRARAAYRLWVRREALAKAQGFGFAWLVPQAESAGWTVRDLALGPGVFAAVAAQGEGLGADIAFRVETADKTACGLPAGARLTTLSALPP